MLTCDNEVPKRWNFHFSSIFICKPDYCLLRFKTTHIIDKISLLRSQGILLSVWNHELKRIFTFDIAPSLVNDTESEKIGTPKASGNSRPNVKFIRREKI